MSNLLQLPKLISHRLPPFLTINVLRNNVGGPTTAISGFCSYFFDADKQIVLDKLYDRQSGTTTELRTLAELTGISEKSPHIDIIGGSASQAFTYSPHDGEQSRVLDITDLLTDEATRKASNYQIIFLQAFKETFPSAAALALFLSSYHFD